MKYKPSRQFLFSIGLLAASFFSLQGLVVPSILDKELSATVLATKNTITAATTVSGTLRKESFEEFNPKTHIITEVSSTFYLDTLSGQSYKINPGNLNLDHLLGKPVLYNAVDKKVNGTERSGGSGLVMVVGSSGSTPPPVVPKRVLLLLADFSNSISVPGTAAQYQDIFFGQSNGYVRKFYNEMTHGQVLLESDVFGWYHFIGPGSAYVGPLGACNLSASNIQAMITYYDIDLSIYDSVITIANCDDYNNLGGAYMGSYEIGKPLIRIKGHNDRLGIDYSNGYLEYPGIIWTVMHELGHKFGLLHSNTLDCVEDTLSNTCSNLEYGNPFDAMGHWGRIFNFLQQEKAGWLDSSNVLVINQSGSYRINNLQARNGFVGAKIIIPGMSYPVYAVEHRKASGFDLVLQDSAYNNVTHGLTLYTKTGQYGKDWTTNDSINNFVWRLIDPHPTTNDIFDDTQHDAITMGNPFVDDELGVSINVTNVDARGIDFDVTLNPSSAFATNCIAQLGMAPSIANTFSLAFDYNGQTYSAGSLPSVHIGDQITLNITTSNYNADLACPLKPYNLAVLSAGSTVPSSWILPSFNKVIVRPQETKVYAYTINIDSTYVPPVSKILRVSISPANPFPTAYTVYNIPINVIP